MVSKSQDGHETAYESEATRYEDGTLAQGTSVERRKQLILLTLEKKGKR